MKSIRIQIDKETGRTKGFAFVEYNDANAALAAIKHLDGHELNGRKLRVSYTTNSQRYLQDYARETGIAMPEASVRTAEYHAVSNMPLSEVWDMLDAMKKMVDEDKSSTHVKALLEAYPQLMGALLEGEKRLGIVSNIQNVSSTTNSSSANTTTQMQQSAPQFQQTAWIPPPPVLAAPPVFTFPPSGQPMNYQPYQQQPPQQYYQQY